MKEEERRKKREKEGKKEGKEEEEIERREENNKKDENKKKEDHRLEFAPELKNDDALVSYVYEDFSAGKCLEEQIDEIISLVNDVPLNTTVWG